MVCNRKKLEWWGKFRCCGYRLTIGRHAILDVLTKTKGHLSAEEIYLKVYDKHPSIGLTSVYRTLDLLSHMGMILKFDFGDGRARYELNNEENHHHHLICTKCKKIIDYADFIDEEIELLKKTEKSLAEKHQFTIKNHVLQFYGLCSECKEE